MRSLLFVCLSVLPAAIAAAQSNGPIGVRHGPSCEAAPYRPQCRCGNSNGCPHCQQPCEKDVPRDIPTGEEQPRDIPSAPREIGQYVAPPRTGTMRGASNFRGFDFGALTLPELRLRLPCIELPSCFLGRTGARMNIDSSVAAWESHGFVSDSPRTIVQQAPSPDEARDRAAAERSACEEYSRKLKEYEDELRRIDDDRKRLEDCIRQCLEANRRDANIPRGEMNCLSNERSGPAAADPNCDRSRSGTVPMNPPVPKPEDARRLLPPSQFPVQYNERPASYITEPQHLPQATPDQAQPIVEPRASIQPDFSPIREPRPIQARITNVRLSR